MPPSLRISKSVGQSQGNAALRVNRLGELQTDRDAYGAVDADDICDTGREDESIGSADQTQEVR